MQQARIGQHRTEQKNTIQWNTIAYIRRQRNKVEWRLGALGIHARCLQICRTDAGESTYVCFQGSMGLVWYLAAL